MFDIKSRAAADTCSFPLRDADDTPLEHADKPCMAVVYGPGSKAYAAALARRQSRAVARLQRGRENSVSAEESSRQGAEFLADITVSLDLAYDGLEGRAKHLAIYSDLSLGFIAEQVAKKASDWANFTQTPATS